MSAGARAGSRRPTGTFVCVALTGALLVAGVPPVAGQEGGPPGAASGPPSASPPPSAAPPPSAEGLPAGNDGPPVASSQDGTRSTRWFPQLRPFPGPTADPLEPGFRGMAVSSDMLRPVNGGGERPPWSVDDLPASGRDYQGVVSLGETFPVVHLRGSGDRDGMIAGLMVGVTARFRLATPRNEMIAHDWVVGLPVEMRSGPWSGRALLFHRSAHLGDELMRTTEVSRVGFGHEGLSILAAREARPGVRTYAGGSWLFRSETSGSLERIGREQGDRLELQVGFDAERALSGMLREVTAVAGLDVKSAERTEWRPQWSALAGGGVRVRNRSARLVARYLRGPSMHGEFFLTRETAWGIEFQLTR